MKNQELKSVVKLLEDLADDISVPRNIRRGAVDAKEILMKDEAVDVTVASAISRLDDMLNDPNIPTHGRTSIWNIMSALETILAN